MDTGDYMKLIAGAIFVIALCYYATYFIANRKIKRIPGRGILVRERFSLSKDKLICVIESKGKAYLVVITNGGATVLETYDVEEIPEPDLREQTDGAEESLHRGYVPNGILATWIWKLVSWIKKATTARTPPQKYNEARQSERQSRSDFTIQVAREEDKIDEIQRRLRNRMASDARTEAGVETAEEPPDE